MVAQGETFAAWLERMMRRADLRAADVARELDVSASLVSRWRHGQIVKPEAEQVAALARLFGVAAAEVAAVTGQALVDAPLASRPVPVPAQWRELVARLEPVLENYEELVLLQEHYIPVPVYDVEAAADVRRIIFTGEGGETMETIPVPREAARQGGSLFALRTRGGCLAPAVPDGAHVVIEQTDDYRVGDTVLAEVDGALHLKRLRHGGGGALLLTGNDGPALPLKEGDRVYGVARCLVTML